MQHTPRNHAKLDPRLPTTTRLLLEEAKLGKTAVDDTLHETGDAALTAENVLAHAVDLDVDGVADLLVGQGQLALGVGDEHDAKGQVAVVDLGDGQARAVDGHKALFHDVRHLVGGRLGELEGIPQAGAVGLDLLDGGDGVDVALHDVSAEPGVCGHGALAVDAGADGQVAEVCPGERLGREADLERVGIKREDREACAVARDRVANVAVAQDRGRVAERDNVLGGGRGGLDVGDGSDVLDLEAGG